MIHPPMLYMGYVGFSVRVRVRDRGAARRAGSTRVGALVAAVDDGGLDRSSPRHRARQLVGLLRARLGRLVVLGSGRERVVHAVARRHGAHPLARRDREARRVQELDRAARDHRVLAVAARHVPRALRRARLRCTRSPPTRARGIFILAFLASCIGGSLALFAWRAPQVGARRRASSSSRASRCCWSTTCCWSSRRRRCCSARCIRSFIDALDLGKISVGPPYFDSVFVPLMAPLLFLMASGRSRAGSVLDAARHARGCAGPAVGGAAQRARAAAG